MGHADVVELLLQEGHAPDGVGANGATPLMVAASLGHVGVMDILIAGASSSADLSLLLVAAVTHDSA